jgi:hypothetical protein
MSRDFRGGTSFLYISVTLGMILFTSVSYADTQETDKSILKVSKLISKELLVGLNQRPPEPKGVKSWVQTSLWAVNKFTDEKSTESKQRNYRRVALWPFWKDGVQVSKNFAKSLTDTVLSELIRGSIPYNRFIAREELTKITQEIDDFNSLNKSAEKISTLMKNAGADLMVMAQVKPLDEATLEIAYKAVEVATGIILAQTHYHQLSYDFEKDKTLSMEAAVKVSARKFLKSLPQIKTIRPQGVHYQDTGIQTSFGKWFARRFLTDLHSQNPKSNTFKIAEAEIDETRLRKRGLKLSEKSIESQMIASSSGDYVFTGEYWDLGKIIDVQVSLLGGNGRRETWQGNIRKSTIPKELTIKPERDLAATRNNDSFGPISLQISSTRGRNPIYRVGQNLVLLIEVSLDSHLYCFYGQANGDLIKIFPNRFYARSLIQAKFVKKIPDKMMKFDWVVEPPTGIEIVKCYAFDRDIKDDLPLSIQQKDFEPLPFNSMDAITHRIRQIRNVAIAENSMVINVER